MAFLPVLCAPAARRAAIPLACMLILTRRVVDCIRRLAPGRARSNAGNWRLMVRLPVWRNAHEEATLDRMKSVIVDDHRASERRAPDARGGRIRGRRRGRLGCRGASGGRDMEPGGGAPRRTSTRHAGLRSCGAPPRGLAPAVVLTSSHGASDFGPLVERTGFIPKSELSGEALRRILVAAQASTDRDRIAGFAAGVGIAVLAANSNHVDLRGAAVALGYCSAGRSSEPASTPGTAGPRTGPERSWLPSGSRGSSARS